MQELKEICTKWVDCREIHEGFTCSVEQVPTIGSPRALAEVFVDFINKDSRCTITVKLHGD